MNQRGLSMNILCASTLRRSRLSLFVKSLRCVQMVSIMAVMVITETAHRGPVYYRFKDDTLRPRNMIFHNFSRSLVAT